MMVHFPCVKLQDQTIRSPLAGVKVRIPEPFVLGSTVTADAREKSLVPAARGLNVAAVDEGLGAHERTIPPLTGSLLQRGFCAFPRSDCGLKDRASYDTIRRCLTKPRLGTPN